MNLICFAVLPLIQRQRAHNIKMAMRAVTGCVRYASSVLDEHNGRNATDLFNEAFRFSNIVQEMYKTMVWLLNYLCVRDY